METEIRNLPSDLRQQSQDSLFFTATALLGFDKLTNHFHYEMCQVMEQADFYKRILMLVPRDHYKSTICTLSYPIWRGLKNPNDTGLIVANSMRNAQRFGSKIKTTFERKPLLRQMYPDLRPENSDRWNKEELCLPRTEDHVEATWSFAGWDTKVTSQHFNYIIYDDLVDEDTYDSPDQMIKLIDRFETREGTLKPPIADQIVVVVMNHWSSIDLACHIIEKHPEYHVYYRQALENGKPLFPEAYSLKWLQNRQRVDPYNFATQWMNNPTDPSAVENKREWLQEYRREDSSVVIYPKTDREEQIPIRSMNIYMSADPRHTLSTKRSDKLTARNALLVGGVDPRGRHFVLDEFAGRCSPEEYVRHMLRLYLKWYPWGLSQLGVEGYGYQAALAPLAKLIWKDEKIIPRIFDLPKNTQQSKETRIRGGYRFFAEGKGFTHRNMIYFNEEFVTFPAGKTKDIGDCWYWITAMAHTPFDDDEWEEQERIDKEHLQSLNQCGI